MIIWKPKAFMSGVGAVVLFLSTLTASVATIPAASAAVVVPQSCPRDGDQYIYSFTSVVVSKRPTDLYSGYITGPGVITYSRTTTATVGASATGTVTAEAGIVFAKASAALAIGLTTSKSWTDGFSYARSVPSGQRRRMRLFEESRAFLVTKKTWNPGLCRYTAVYSNNAANAPRTERNDEWVLEK